MEFFRKPVHADATGDAIPFYHQGKYHIFSLTPPPGTSVYPDRLRTTWHHVSSDNLIDWLDIGEALAPGKGSEPDADGCWTGSVIFGEGAFHSFYTGYNIGAEFPQTICHACSNDGVAWSKDSSNPIIVPRTDLYESLDWRDPYAFFNEEDQRYWLILSARKKQGPPGRRGCIVLYRSVDLKAWEHFGPIHEPWHTNCPECPELYRIGDTWYLAYSRFSEFGGTIYRVSDNPFGGWRTPEHDRIGSRRFYAAKSLRNDDGRRYYFGWTPDRANASDRGDWYWGGILTAPHEVVPNSEGLLEVRLPTVIAERFRNPIEWRYIHGIGKAKATKDQVEVRSPGTLTYGFLEFSEKRFLFTCKVSVEDCRDHFGLALKSSSDLGRCLLLAIEPSARRASLIDYPFSVDPFWEASVASMGQAALPGPDGPRVAEAFLEMKPDEPVDIQVLVDGDLVEVFVANRVALNYRWYGAVDYEIGIVTQDGNVKYHDIEIATAE